MLIASSRAIQLTIVPNKDSAESPGAMVIIQATFILEAWEQLLINMPATLLHLRLKHQIERMNSQFLMAKSKDEMIIHPLPAWHYF